MLSRKADLKGKGKEVKISLSIIRASSTSTTTMDGKDTNGFDIELVPDDVWLTLFEHLSSTELCALARTCRKFCLLTQRPLLRELTWAKAAAAERNVQDWGDGGPLEGFKGIVRRLKIRLSYKKVNQNGALVTPIDWELYDSVFYRLHSFSNLRSLELVDTIITPALYPVLAAIPSLRELSIIHCTFVWSFLYPAILSNLGRPCPSGDTHVANPSRLHSGHARAPLDPSQRVEYEKWLLDNATFNFAEQLAHITHLTFQYNRMGHQNDEPNRTADNIPFPPSEIHKPSILHPLYLLSLPSLTEISLSWNGALMQVYDTLKQNFNFGTPAAAVNNANVPAAIPAAANPLATLQPQFGHQLPTIAMLLHAANPFGINLFQSLHLTFPSLRHVTLMVEDLSRDMMDSIVSLFDRRINSPAPDVGPLRILLKVAKHTLTEQHIGSVQFRLPGVYRYEGPLPIAGLLALGTGGENAAPLGSMEELRMTEAMDMTMILYTLEKLPKSMQKLDIRMYAWDQEILYAVRSLFKELKELIVRYGKGSMKENTHIILGSDILPDMKQLHTLKLLPSADCVKREQQFRYPFLNHAHAHGHISPAANWWAMSNINTIAMNQLAAHGGITNQVQLDADDDADDDDDGGFVAAHQALDPLAEAVTDVPSFVDNDDSFEGLATNEYLATANSAASTSTATVTQTTIASPALQPQAGPSSAASSTNNFDYIPAHVFPPFGTRRPFSGFRHSCSSDRQGQTGVATTEHMLSELDEQRRIAQSLKEDLEDYLVGWNRHCPKLRVVQMEHGVCWARRFDGDLWVCKERSVW